MTRWELGGSTWKRAWVRLVIVLGIGALSASGCGAPEEEILAQRSALTGQDVMGFETLDSWTPQSGTEALVTNRTQGAFAYALTAPVNFTFINSAAVESTTPNLQGLATAGSSFAIDFIIPPQQPNPFFFGSLQLLVTVPSRAVNNLFLGQVELTGLPTGVFQTLRFPIPDSLRNALRGQTFTDLTFSLALNAPSGATGTYVFDNLRVVAANNADFTLTPNPANVTVTQGATATSTIAIARVGGFAAGVAFTASGLPAGVTATFNPATTTGNSTVVTFTAAANATVGPATVIITGTGGGLSRTTTINLTVNAGANFTLAPNPANVTVVQGATATSTITIARTGGFVASVAFSATGLPAGVTATFTPAATTGNTTVVTFTAAANAAVGGPTPVTITGVGGGLTRTTTINLTVAPAPNFTLAAAPANVTVVQGATATSTVMIARTGGFAATVAFSATGLPAGVTATFNPAATTGNTTVVTFTAAPNAAVGGPTAVTITGVGGGLTRTTTINLTVAAAPDFALAATPASVTVEIGSSAASTVAVMRLGGFVAGVSFSASGVPGGVTATFDPVSTTGNSTVVTFSASDSATPGTASVVVTGTGGGLTRTTTIQLAVVRPAGDFALSASPSGISLTQGDSAQSLITIVRIDGFPSTISFGATGLPAGVTATFSPAATSGDSTTLTLNVSASAATGPATVTIVGVGGGLTRTTDIDLFVNAAPVPDFALSASPSGIGVAQGDTAQSLIGILRINGFVGSVAFSATGLPAGVTATFNPLSASGDSATLTLAASLAAAPGSATITVTGTGGGLTRTTLIDLFVAAQPQADFALAASPAALAAQQGDSVQSVITIGRIGFLGSVAFSASGLPGGVTATFNPAATTGDSTTLTLDVGAAATTGSATITVTGTGGGLTRAVDISLFINQTPTGDFALSASPSGFGPTQGESVQSFITISRFGFTGSVAFSASGLPSGVTATFDPLSTAGDVTLLTLDIGAAATPGPATIVVAGTGGGVTRFAEIQLFINQAPTPDFVISASPSGIGMAAGDSAQSLIAISRFGFTGSVTFSALGLPPGVIASFDPSPAGGDATTLTLTAAPDAPTVSATITIVGTGGGLTRVTSIDLFVNGAPVVP